MKLFGLLQRRKSLLNGEDVWRSGLNGSWSGRELQYKIRQEQCADLFERYNHMIADTGPSLEHGFMMAIGRHELAVFRLSVEVRKWKRRFELRQMALNRGERPNYVEIEAELDSEFAAFNEEMAKRTGPVNQAETYYSRPVLTQAQSTEMRMLYLKAAKKLHPDVNHELSESAGALWQRIGDAYRKREWRELKYLTALIGDVAEQPKTFPDTADGETELARECERLKEVCRRQQEMINALQEKLPWAYAVLLDDAEALAARQKELFDDIEAYEKRIEAFQREWEGAIAR